MKKNTDDTGIKRRSTFAILFYINRTKVRKDGMCQLLCKISIDAKWEQIGTKVSVNPAIWNPEKGRADGRSENAITVNRAIDDLTKEIREHYRRIKNSLGFITAEQIKNAVMGIGQKPLTLLALFREHNEEFKKRVGIDRIKETYESYLRSYKHLSAFVQQKCGAEDVLLRNLDRVFYDDFELFLRTDRNLSPKSVHEHPLEGKSVLDLGCGYGWHCKFAEEQGATKILGIDLSKKMIEEAQKRNSGNQIEYRISGLEEYDYPENEWDCVISNLALHYIEDIVEIFQKVYRTLKPGGIFLFNIEHPVFTAGVGQDWIYTDDGKPQYWAIDNYFITGERNTHFLGCDVVKQHHTLTQIIMGLLNNGFELKVVEEAEPPKEMMDIPGMEDELRRPMMLLVKAIAKK